MAYQQNFKDDDEQKQGTSGAGQVLTGQSSQMGTESGGSTPGQAQSKPTSSGAWTNLQSYVKANEGNDAAMGNKIRSGIENRANTATQNANNYKTRADGQIEAGTVRDDGIIEQVKTSPTDIINNVRPGQPQQVADTTTAGEVSNVLNGVATNQNPPSDEWTRRNQFDHQWDAYYSGPNAANEIEGYQDSRAEHARVEDRAKKSQTYEGAQALLRDEYERPNYTQGENQLDAFILGAGQQGRGVLEGINNDFSNFSSGWNDVVNQVGGNIQQGIDTTDATRIGTQSATKDNIARHTGIFEGYQGDLDAEAQARAEAYEKMVASGDYSGAGIDPELASWLKGTANMDPFKMVSQAGNRGIGDVVKDSEVEDYGSLIDLGRQKNELARTFETTGNSADGVANVNEKMIASATKAKDIHTRATAAADKANRERAQQAGAVRAMLENPAANQKQLPALAQELGIEPWKLSHALQSGIDVSGMLKDAPLYDAGDFASDKDRNAWTQVIASLGSSGFSMSPNALRDSGNKGKNPYTFDKKAFDKAFATLPPPPMIASGADTMSGKDGSGGYIGQQAGNVAKVANNVYKNAPKPRIKV